MEKYISLYELGMISYKRDIECNSYRLKLCEYKEEDEIKYDDATYRGDFNRKIKPIIQKYSVDKMKDDDIQRYLIPKKEVNTLINIYYLLNDGYSTVRKISNKKYVSAEALKKEIDSLDMKEEDKIKILEFFEYYVRLAIDSLKDDILTNLNNSLDYILMPYNDNKSETKDPKLLDRKDKKKNKEEFISIEEKLKIIEYISKKHNDFIFNLQCLVNDIAMSRREDDKEDINLLINRLSYWE